VPPQSLLLSAFSVICNTLASAELFIVITCRSNSTCTNRGMFSVLMLELQWVRSLADIFIGVRCPPTSLKYFESRWTSLIV